MPFTLDDYYPPLAGELDNRRLAMFEDNHGWTWEFSSEHTEAGLRVLVTVDDSKFEAEHADGQTALDLAIDKAIATLGA